MKTWIAVALLLATATASAQSTAGAYRVLPSFASTRGGTEIVFRLVVSDCPFNLTFVVKVDGVAVPTAERQGCYEIAATLPAHAAGAANVVLEISGSPIPVTPPIQYIDPASTPDLNFFDRILVPVFADAPGAFGSFWKSEGELRNVPGNASNDFAPYTTPSTSVEWFYDVNRSLCASGCPVIPPLGRLPLETFGQRPAGFILFVPKETSRRVVAVARVRDISRPEQSWGAEIPIAREDDLRRVIVIPDVPTDARYRATLRIYRLLGRTQTAKVLVHTRDGRTITHVATLQGPCPLGGTQCNSAQPAYAVVDVSALTIPSDGPVTLEIGPEFRPGLADLWAFVSVTNKETQHVTTVRPQ